MRVLVTGGTGFIGTHLARALAEAGHEPVTLARHPAPSGWPFAHVAADVAGEASDLASLGSFDAVAHLAGSADAAASLADPLGYARAHALGTLNLLAAARQWGARFVLASSQRVYRPAAVPLAEDAPTEPVDPYGYAKLAAEQWVAMYARLYQLPTVVLRFFSVYGPGQRAGEQSGVLTIFVRQALDGLPLRAEAGVLRDFTAVDDVVRGLGLALARPQAPGRTFNIATGRATTVAELARLVTAVTGSGSEIVLAGEAGPAQARGYVADISRARRELGYQPAIEVERGIARYVEQIAHAHSAQGASDR
ncbi:MAG TPA: NAD-dependent epimerase/dehydratase family protein [Thermomicrobiaceae bacterium]|nr:NAD-dependent epimerase/dehydratase family protein [Thermomicrobiaceae bacterium]